MEPGRRGGNGTRRAGKDRLISLPIRLDHLALADIRRKRYATDTIKQRVAQWVAQSDGTAVALFSSGGGARALAQHLVELLHALAKADGAELADEGCEELRDVGHVDIFEPVDP